MNTKIFKLSVLSVIFGLGSCASDDGNSAENVIAELASSEKGNFTKECNYVDNNWSSSAVLSTSFGSSTDTNFMNNQNSKIASVWGRPSVLLRFVKDVTNPGSTYNAISYSSQKIYYGEAIYKDAKTYGQIVNAMILAHEFGHQLQYTYGIPSVNETTARASELEADGMAGYYLRRPTGYNQSSFAAIAPAYDFAFKIGDYATTSSGHHGTPPQRRSAVRLGFLLGQYSLSALDFDANFFYYYSGVLNGTYRSAKPAGYNAEIDAYIKSHANELKDIMTGKMSKETYYQLD
ncbi:MAG: hypothetical protein ACI9XR_001000 [Flavobacterium sp.]|jgi:hypothetical protein